MFYAECNEVSVGLCLDLKVVFAIVDLDFVSLFFSNSFDSFLNCAIIMGHPFNI